MIDIRKIITLREVVYSELGVAAHRPVVRAVGMAVILNPFAGRFVDDLRALFEAGAMLGERLMPAATRLARSPVARSLSSCGSSTPMTERQCASTPRAFLSRPRPTSLGSNLHCCTRMPGSWFSWNAGRPALTSRCLFPAGSSCSFWTAALPKATRSSPGSRGSDSRPAQRCKQLQDKAAAWSGSSQATSHVSRCGQLHADVL